MVEALTDKEKKKSRRSKKLRRTQEEIDEEQTRTLYVRFPKTLKSEDEVKSLFSGDFKVKIPRQSTRYCHVIFSNVEEKNKNWEEARFKTINNKRILVCPPRPMKLENIIKKKRKQKKIIIPVPEKKSEVGKYIFVSNLPPGIKASQVRDAFPGSITVGLLKSLQARVKIAEPSLCTYYVKNKSKWPVFKGKKCIVSYSIKSLSKSKTPKEKSTSLKIYDGEKEIKEVFKSPRKNKSTVDKSVVSNDEEQLSDEKDNESHDDQDEESEEDSSDEE